MSHALLCEERRLVFEAQRFSLEMLIKVHLENAEGARLFLVSHSRMMFTLALGALAAVVTLYAAVLRLGGEKALMTATTVEIALATASLGLLVTGSLFATSALRAAATSAVDLQTDPFSNAEPFIQGLLQSSATNEKVVLDNLVEILMRRLEREKPQPPKTIAIACCLFSGLACAGLSLVSQWLPS